MVKFFSTFASGLTPVIAQFLQTDINLRFINQWDGFIEYYADISQLDRIRHLPYLQNTFVIIDSHHGDINSMLNALSKLKGFSFDRQLIPNKKRTFRVVVSEENKLIGINNDTMLHIEKNICNVTGLNVDRKNPGCQFWVLHRSEGYSFFAIRVTELKTEDKDRARGELRPQLAYVLARMSEPKENELFIDPCCGSGSIPFARIKMTKKGLIIACDNDGQLISMLKEKVKKLDLKKKFVVRQSDVLELHNYYHSCIHKVVSDPPWGCFEEIDDIIGFYDRLIGELLEVLVPNGIMVLLIGTDVFPKVLEKYKDACSLLGKYDILVSGKKASIYKIEKL